jgi:ribosomal protein S12 methylthiotransferase
MQELRVLKTKGKSKTSINVITLGCPKNLVDSEVLLKQLVENNFVVSHNSSSFHHDIVIVNTCGFINDAKQESIDTIMQIVDAKRKGLVKKVLVSGCLSARYRDELIKEIPEVDAFFGVNKLKEIVGFLEADYKKNLIGERLLTTPEHYAYLKIAEGCDRKCSFCAIPLIRGKHVSKPEGYILKEVKKLAENGVKEIILIAQDLTYYGVDLYKRRMLAGLLEKLSVVKGIEWIRLQYAYPSSFPMDVLDVMQEHENICRYLDIPFQHINDRLLKSMERGITRDGTYRLIEKIRKKVPEIALRTSLIAGYPGETEKEFSELMQFVKDVRFERLGVFSYSHEESTKAFNLKDDVSQAVKKRRIEKLMKQQERISLEKNKSLIGTVIQVLIDRREGDFYIGRTEFDSPEVDNEVIISSPVRSGIVGQYMDVKITGVEAYDLFAESAL